MNRGGENRLKLKAELHAALGFSEASGRFLIAPPSDGLQYSANRKIA
jgi:hypothetical protein